MARRAFVRAAAARCRLRNGRVNHSRVAAQTGLTRSDVKRLLSPSSGGPIKPSRPSAVDRVADGWRTDSRFTTRKGQPRRLRIAGANADFHLLARKYAGDIPPRAVLAELQIVDAVSVRGKTVQLTAGPLKRRNRELGFLTSILPAFVDGLRVASHSADPSSKESILRLVLPVSSELDLAFARERCASTARSMLEGLSHSIGGQGTAYRGPRSKGSSFSVTVLLAEHRARNLARTAESTRRRGRGNGQSHK